MTPARAVLLSMLTGCLLASPGRARPAEPIAAPPPAARAQPDDPGDSEIVVTGERGALSERIRAFVASITPETGNAQVARWDRLVCLNVEGVSPAQRDYFGGTIAESGRELGLDVVQGAACEPSAYVIFSRDPEALLSRIEATRPRFFGSIPPYRRRELIESPAPVRWLSFAQLRGADGEVPAGFYADVRAGGRERPVPAVSTIPSRIQTGGRMDLQSMVVLVDASRLEGVSNRSLAAYLAMILLGNVRPDHRLTGFDSILAIVGGQRQGMLVTDGLTDWDRAYLRSLYAGGWNLPAAQRMQRIGAAMERELAAGAAASR